MADQLEFDEREIWEEGNEDANGVDSAEEEAGTPEQGQGTKRGASSGSSSDSDFDEQLDQLHNIKAFRGEGYTPGSIPAFVPRPGTSTDSVAIDFGASNGRAHHRSTSRRNSLEGRPQRPSKLGTSMPINIPMMNRPPSEVPHTDKQDKATTFVPPYLLLQDDEEKKAGTSVGSASILGSASVKREKLLQRNAILRRTGFIESGTSKGALAELMDPLNRRMMPIKEGLETSALSAALGTSPSPQH